MDKINIIRTARLKAGMTQTQLGARLGVGKAAVSAWENWREVPSTQRLSRLARALDPHLDLHAYLAQVAAAKSSPKARAA